MLRFLAVYALFGAILLAGCSDDNLEEDFGPMNPDTTDTACNIPDTVTYTEHVGVIFQTNCTDAGCHNPEDLTQGMDFTAFATTRQAVDNGRPIRDALRGRNGQEQMPFQQTPLPECDIRLIEAWIEQGAPE